MIGTRVALRTHAPYAAYLCLCVALGLVALSPATKGATVPAFVLPLAVGLALLLGPERRFLARFTPSGLEVAHPAHTIPYANLREVHPIAPFDQARPTAFPIWIVHSGGSLTIPAPLTVSSERVSTYCGRRTAPRPLAAWRPVGYALAVTGLLWALLPLVRANNLGWGI